MNCRRSWENHEYIHLLYMERLCSCNLRPLKKVLPKGIQHWMMKVEKYSLCEISSSYFEQWPSYHVQRRTCLIIRKEATTQRIYLIAKITHQNSMLHVNDAYLCVRNVRFWFRELCVFPPVYSFVVSFWKAQGDVKAKPSLGLSRDWKQTLKRRTIPDEYPSR